MDDWECTLCGEQVPASEIVSMNHYRLMHPDKDLSIRGQVQIPNTWPDGEVVYFEDFETPADIEDPGTFI
jgi:hypothetical protein